jgi:phage gp29-like protein
MSTVKKSYLFGLFSTEKSQPTAAAGNISKKDKAIITSLADELADKSRADIEKWRQAIQASENADDPRWSLLQDLYENLATDGHLMANIDIRKSAVLGNRFFVRNAKGKEDKEKTAQFQQKWFYDLMDHLLDTVYFGYTVMELTNPETKQFTLIPRRNYCPQKNFIYFEAAGTSGVNITDPMYAGRVVTLHNSRIKGIINDIVPQLIWKRNAQQTWADFAEKFGIPLVSAETNKTDKDEINRMQAMLDAMGQGASAVMPQGTSIEIHHDTQKGDPHKVFKEQIAITNSEVSKRIVGGTMLADDGSSRSQSEVHERTLNDKFAEADRRNIEFKVNELRELWRSLGLKFDEGDSFLFDRSEDLTLTQHWSIVNTALYHYEIDQDWIGRTFNMPIKGKKEQTRNDGGLSANFQ